MAEKSPAAASAAKPAPDAARSPAEVSLDLILDVDVTLALEVGRTRIKVRDLLQLSQGSILELDRMAGEPLDVLVNGVQVARGEVVVVNDNFGLRLTEVVSPRERKEALK